LPSIAVPQSAPVWLRHIHPGIEQIAYTNLAAVHAEQNPWLFLLAVKYCYPCMI
jgi:hypothetical protein